MQIQLVVVTESGVLFWQHHLTAREEEAAGWWVFWFVMKRGERTHAKL